MFSRPKSFLLIPAIVLFLVSGCVSSITDTFSSGPKANPQDESFADFMDVPFPAHMAFNKKESFSYDRRGGKAGVVVVSGKMNRDEVGAYYDQHLPPHGWTPLAEAQSAVLASTWKKGDRILTIIARPETFTLTTSCKLELWVGAPFTKDDLGSRVMYQKPTIGDGGGSGSSGGSSGTGHSDKNGVSEEDI